jgi:hypothetical protein
MLASTSEGQGTWGRGHGISNGLFKRRNHSVKILSRAENSSTKVGAQVLRHQLWIEVCSKDDLFCADGSQ